MNSYKLNTTIDGIKNFSVSEENLVLIREEEILFNGEMLLNSKRDLYNMGFFVNANLLVYGNLETSVRFDIKQNLKQQLNPRWTYYWDTLHHEQVLVSSNRRKTENGRNIADYFLYDFNRQELKDLNFTESPNLYYQNGIVFVHEKNQSIRAYDLSSLQHLWEVNFEKTGRDLYQDSEVRIRQIIGVQEKNFLLSLSNLEIINLDIDSGNVLWHTKHFVQQYLSDWRNRSLLTFFYWYLEKGILYQLDGNRYLSMNLNNKDVQVLWEDTAEEDYLTIAHKKYTPEYIYFTASRNYAISPELIGVFDRNSMKVDWVSSVNNLRGSLNQPPLVFGNKLYVRDSGKALHIFERS